MTYEAAAPSAVPATSAMGDEEGAPQGGRVDRVREMRRAARAARTEELDRWLAGLLGAEPGLTLVAVGSHARREITPGGDLDLVLLHNGTWAAEHVAAVADRIWYPIWDSGLRLDHSVRTVTEAREVARADMKAALGLLSARRIAGDHALFDELRTGVLADWRADARRRLAELAAMTRARWADQGELAFLLEGDIKEARGGLRDVQAIYAVAASWVAPAPSDRVRAAGDLLLDVRHVLHEVTGRPADRLILQEQEAVAQALGLLDANVLLRTIAEAARTIAYAADQVWHRVDRFTAAAPGRTAKAERSPLADGVVEQDGEAVLARGADLSDPVLVLRAAAAAAQAGLPLAPATVERLAESTPPMPVPWPPAARDALVALLGAGSSAIGVWEALDQAGLIVRLLPDWERVRNRPQRNPVHRFTVDRHLVEAAAAAAALTREVARPDLLLIGGLLHDIGKGWPGDHSRSGAVVARDLGVRMGFRPADVDVLEALVRHHLLLPDTATRRDLDDPVTVRSVADTLQTPVVVELLAALAVADGLSTGPAAWGTWKAGLVAELARRVIAVLEGPTPRRVSEPTHSHLGLVRHGGGAVRISRLPTLDTPVVSGPQPLHVTIAAPDRPGLLWHAAGVLALHRLAVRTARASSPGLGTPHPPSAPATGVPGGTSSAGVGAPSARESGAAGASGNVGATASGTSDEARVTASKGRSGGGATAVLEFTVLPEFGTPPDPATLEADLRRVLADRLDVAARLERRSASARTRPGVPVPPPRVTIVADASATATVVEVRAHDRPGLLWRIGQALGEQGLQVRAAQVDTLGADAVDVFYVLDEHGHPIADDTRLVAIREHVLAALR